MATWKVKRKLYFVWHMPAYYEWLQSMSKDGWELVSCKGVAVHYFVKNDPPQEYKYLWERKLFLWWQLDDETTYIEKKEAEGWNFFTYASGWWYGFKRMVNK